MFVGHSHGFADHRALAWLLCIERNQETSLLELQTLRNVHGCVLTVDKEKNILIYIHII